MTPEEIRRLVPKDTESDDGTAVFACVMLQEIAAHLAEQNDILYDLFTELQAWRRQL